MGCEKKKILLPEGFELVFYKAAQKSNIVDIVGVMYKEEMVLKGWISLTRFVATLESGLKNNLGVKKRYHIDQTVVFGTFENEFSVNIMLASTDEEILGSLALDKVQCQQLVSVLNKLLHAANKFYDAKASYLYGDS